MNTIKATFAAAVLLIVGVWLYEVSDYLLVWSRRVAFLAGQGARVCGGVLLLLALVGCVVYLRRQRHEQMRQRDGAWAAEYQPLVVGPRRAWLWLWGRPAPKLRLDPNAHLGHALVIDAAGVHEFAPAAGWDRQAAYMADQERTNRARAIAPGDAAISLPWFGGDVRAGIPNAATGRLLGGAYDLTPRPRPTVTVERPAEPLQLPPPPPLMPQDAIANSRPASLVLGQTDGGDLVRWEMAQTPHLRFHGATRGAGKTNAIQTVAAAALRTGAHVVVFDPAQLKDWGEFAGCAELVDASDPATLADGAARLMTIYHQRTRALAEEGARDLSGLAHPRRRIVVVIAEFGAQCELARAEGVMSDIETPLLQLARKAAAAGIHLVLEDQAIVRWPRALSANVAGVAIGRMPLYSAQACGFVPRRGATTETLQPGQFWFGGQLVNVPHMQPALRELLADVPAPRLRVMNTPRWEGAGNVSQSVRGGVFPEVETSETAETPTPQANGNTGNTDPAKWDAFILDYMTTHPELWQTPPSGVRELARAMSRHDTGNEASEDSYVSIASKTTKRYREEAYLPSGAKLGTDITGGA